MLSKEEREAEVIFILSKIGLIDRYEFIYMANHLQYRSYMASRYLYWLCMRCATNEPPQYLGEIDFSKLKCHF